MQSEIFAKSGMKWCQLPQKESLMGNLPTFSLIFKAWVQALREMQPPPPLF